MQRAKVMEHATALYRAHGDRAEAEAAQKAAEEEKLGRTTIAEDWRAVRDAIRTLRGANES